MRSLLRHGQGFHILSEHISRCQQSFVYVHLSFKLILSTLLFDINYSLCIPSLCMYKNTQRTFATSSQSKHAKAPAKARTKEVRAPSVLCCVPAPVNKDTEVAEELPLLAEVPAETAAVVDEDRMVVDSEGEPLAATVAAADADALAAADVDALAAEEEDGPDDEPLCTDLAKMPPSTFLLT